MNDIKSSRLPAAATATSPKIAGGGGGESNPNLLTRRKLLQAIPAAGAAWLGTLALSACGGGGSSSSAEPEMKGPFADFTAVVCSDGYEPDGFRRAINPRTLTGRSAIEGGSGRYGMPIAVAIRANADGTGCMMQRVALPAGAADLRTSAMAAHLPADTLVAVYAVLGETDPDSGNPAFRAFGPGENWVAADPGFYDLLDLSTNPTLAAYAIRPKGSSREGTITVLVDQEEPGDSPGPHRIFTVEFARLAAPA